LSNWFLNHKQIIIRLSNKTDKELIKLDSLKDIKRSQTLNFIDFKTKRKCKQVANTIEIKILKQKK
jgi:hypothetical protein